MDRGYAASGSISTARGLRNPLLITAVHPLKIDNPMPAPRLHVARVELQRLAELPVGVRPVPIPHPHAPQRCGPRPGRGPARRPAARRPAPAVAHWAD